ncbi:MAG: CocE/NonD family hydrolase [Gammaproteobacteria bacterium]
MFGKSIGAGLITLLAIGAACAAEAQPEPIDYAKVRLQSFVKIPLRDGVRLSGDLYFPDSGVAPRACVLTMTPYISQTYHERGVYFAAHGYVFAAVDVRGRGDSEGEFRPLIQEANDGYDTVEWLARQPYCNGKVGMWGGSYAGYNQWAAAKEKPPHLLTIVPAAAPYAGADFPMLNNIPSTYLIQWLSFTQGHTSKDQLFADFNWWLAQNRRWLESGASFESLDGLLGAPSPSFHEWLQHPAVDEYWDRYNPTARQYAELHLPILTITASHDDDQPGALAHYRQHMKNASDAERARHYLIIGPWDHAGTRTPKAEVGGLKFGPASLVDLPKLHLDWYAWTMLGGDKPEFLKDKVAYYVMFADRWRYAASLDAVTAEARPLLLDSRGGANDLYGSGAMLASAAGGSPDHYVYDPRDVSGAALEQQVDPTSYVDQRLLNGRNGKQLVYHSAPFTQDTEVSGFFKLSAWIAIDQPDTDFTAGVYEVRDDGGSILLTSQVLRARYRESLRESKPVSTKAPLRYDFNQFTFASQEIKRGSRLRLVIGPINSIYMEKNYNTGGVTSKETVKDARTVTVTLFHDRAHPSTLYVPMGRP